MIRSSDVIEPLDIKTLAERFRGERLTLLLAGGFEERAITFLKRLRDAEVSILNVVVLQYGDRALNEPTLSTILSEASCVSQNVVTIDDTDIATLSECSLSWGSTRVLCDISAMDRLGLFRVLHCMTRLECPVDIVYTEAEEYYPLKEFYESLLAPAQTDEQRFYRYLEEEETPVAYSYECDLVHPEEMLGSPEPGRPFMLVSFCAFKRSRVQTVLQAIEFQKRLLIVSEPVRHDLRWRKHCMEIVNWDLLQSCAADVRTLPTLSITGVAEMLEECVYGTGAYRRFNVVLAPLGSKMQSVGCYLFWRRHQDIAVVLSRPRRFFPKTFSKGARDTFSFSLQKLLKS